EPHHVGGIGGSRRRRRTVASRPRHKGHGVGNALGRHRAWVRERCWQVSGRRAGRGGGSLRRRGLGLTPTLRVSVPLLVLAYLVLVYPAVLAVVSLALTLPMTRFCVVVASLLVPFARRVLVALTVAVSVAVCSRLRLALGVRLSCAGVL